MLIKFGCIFYCLSKKYLAGLVVNIAARTLQLTVSNIDGIGFVECVLLLKFVGCFEFFEIRKVFCLGRRSYGSGLNNRAEFPVLSHGNLADVTRTVVLMTVEMAKRTSPDALIEVQGGALIGAVWLTFQPSWQWCQVQERSCQSFLYVSLIKYDST